MPSTPNYGWPTPDDNDAIADGASAIRDLGDAADGQLADHVDTSNPHPGSASTSALNSHANATGPSAHDHMARVTSGSYTGTGSTAQTISLPFTPALVVISTAETFGSFADANGMAAWLQSTSGQTPILTPVGGSTRSSLRIVSNGFELSSTDACNRSGFTFRYVAFA